MMTIIYHIASFVVGFCVSSATIHVWMYNTIRWPVTYLSVSVLALAVRQILMKDAARHELARTRRVI